eukprot:6621798-Prymnesium_polylepis.1
MRVSRNVSRDSRHSRICAHVSRTFRECHPGQYARFAHVSRTFRDGFTVLICVPSWPPLDLGSKAAASQKRREAVQKRPEA